MTRLELFLLPGGGALKNCEAGMHLRASIVQNHLQPCRRWIRKGEQSQALSRVQAQRFANFMGELLKGFVGKVGKTRNHVNHCIAGPHENQNAVVPGSARPGPCTVFLSIQL